MRKQNILWEKTIFSQSKYYVFCHRKERFEKDENDNLRMKTFNGVVALTVEGLETTAEIEAVKRSAQILHYTLAALLLRSCRDTGDSGMEPQVQCEDCCRAVLSRLLRACYRREGWSVDQCFGYFQLSEGGSGRQSAQTHQSSCLWT